GSSARGGRSFCWPKRIVDARQAGTCGTARSNSEQNNAGVLPRSTVSFPPMRRVLRKVFVLVTALAFVAGMVQRSALAQGAPCPVNNAQTHSAHAEHTGHDHHHHGTP